MKLNLKLGEFKYNFVPKRVLLDHLDSTYQSNDLLSFLNHKNRQLKTLMTQIVMWCIVIYLENTIKMKDDLAEGEEFNSDTL